MPKPSIDFHGLAADLLGRARSILPQWLPQGRFVGREFVVGNLAGEQGDSLSINTQTGRWADFASGEKGGDLISLYAAIRRIGQADAARELGAQTPTTPHMPRTEPAAPKAQEPDRSSLGKPPPDAEPPTFRHPQWGKAKAHWRYTDADGSTIGYISRHDPKDRRKQYLPWTWDTNRQRWRNLAFPEPRPLYGLDLLAKHPDKPAMIVEGEKAADAARSMRGNSYVVVTWPGGAKAQGKVDWTPLRGRQVLLWPDADPAGIEAMHKIAAILRTHCPEIKIIDTSGQPDGWDLADAAAEGWAWQKLVEWAKPRAKTWEPPAEPEPPEPEPDEPEPEDQKMSIFAHWDEMGLQKNSNGAPYPNLDNAVRVLENHYPLKGLIWYEEFSEKIMSRWHDEPREWTDADDVALCLYLQRDVGIGRMSVGTTHDAVTVVARRNTRHECRDWMESLTWDGTPRLARLLPEGFGTEDSEYHQRVGECWFISMAARIYRPGCKVDTMPVLEGKQGAGKSTALSIIGGDWFTECHESVLTKDFYGVLKGHLVVEISEMNAFTRAEVERIKGVISCQVDRYRAPYGRNTEDHPRQSVFAGTTNRTDWNRDETGARRFWPVRCGPVNLSWISGNRTQLFAEAVHRFKAGEAWWTVPAEAAEAEQEARRQADSWEDAIEDWMREQGIGVWGEHPLTIREVLNDALKIEPAKQGRTEQLRAAAALRALGWESRVLRDGAKTRRTWVRKDQATDGV